jgi:K+-transporting ATPase KdpF subunit
MLDSFWFLLSGLLVGYWAAWMLGCAVPGTGERRFRGWKHARPKPEPDDAGRLGPCKTSSFSRSPSGSSWRRRSTSAGANASEAGFRMSEYVWTSALTLALLGYLVYALLKPERF